MTDFDEHLGELSPEQQELFALLQSQRENDPAATAERLPLTFAQQRLWFIEQSAPGNLAYNIPFAFRITGPLDAHALESALNHVLQRHEALRATIVSQNGEPLQIIAHELTIALLAVDLRDVPAERRESEAKKLFMAKTRVPFDFEHGPLIRAKLLRLNTSEHVLLFVIHHCIFDGPSIEIFFRELSSAYDDCRAGLEPRLPQCAMSYASLVQAELEAMNGDALAGNLKFWTRQLASAPPFLDLPADRQRSPVQTFHGAHHEFALPADLSDAVRSLARREGVTLFMALLAAYQCVLFRHSQQEEIVVGTATANRSRLDSDGVVGFFASTIPLRTSFAGDPSFSELLHRVRDMATEAYSHDETPFEKIVAAIRPMRDASRNPIFQHLFILHGKALEEYFKPPGLSVSRFAFAGETAMVDLTLFVSDGQQELQVEFEYNTDLFDGPTIARFATHFENLLRAAVRNPGKRVSQLGMLSDSEREELIHKWNATASEFPAEKCVHELFEEQAQKTPDAVAVEFGDRQWTYGEMNSRANQLSHHLQKLGVRPDVPVGFCIERSAEMIVGLLGILKAGGSYVALDPAWPSERLAWILDEAQSPLLLTTAALRSCFENSNVAFLCMDSDHAAIDVEETRNPAAVATAESLAYISFTSGSTGRPKGVCVPHRAVIRLVRNTNYARLTAGEIFLQLAPLPFDASTFEIWGALLNGARLVVYPSQPLSLAELGDALGRHRVTTLWLTAGLFHQMVELRIGDLRGVRQLLCGGDVLSVARVREALEGLPGCALINGYGPTENTTFTCCHRITAAPPGRSIPIGRPISNTTVYIVDRHMQPVPIGVAGELCTGGAGLARGYLRDADLDAEKFVPNPFSDEPGAKLYKTGDLARYLADGTIEFLGRMDQQVKIRGHRVEVGEIETVLSSHPAIRNCAVIARTNPAGEKQLVAFVVPKENAAPTAQGLRVFLARKLPDYMIPSEFSTLAALPLTPNGKLDQRALPASEFRNEPPRDFTPPQNSVQAGLIAIWEDVLKRQSIGIRDDFFTVGGHSLLALRMLGEIRSRFGIDIPAQRLFETPTIEGLAQFISERMPAAVVPATCSLIAIQRGDPSRQRLFLVPGGWGGEIEFLVYGQLSREIDPALPVWGLKARGAGTGDAPHSSVTEMAADYLREIRQMQPHGPYLLAGECLGGICAHEMACQLEDAGEKVALLLLLDTSVPDLSKIPDVLSDYFAAETRRRGAESRRITLRERLRHHLGKMSGLSLAEKFGYVFQRIARRPKAVPDSDSAAQKQHPRGQKDYPVTLLQHRLREYHGTVTLLLDEESSRLHGTMGWETIPVARLETHVLPGTHLSYIRENAAATAAKIRELLIQTQTNHHAPATA